MWTKRHKREWERTADPERDRWKRWQPWEVNTVRRLHEDGWTAQAIALHLGRSYTVTRQRVKEIGAA